MVRPAWDCGRLRFHAQSWIVTGSRADTYRYGRDQMAKGQLRSNKEKKKPKQSKRPSGPAVPFGSSQSKSAVPVPAKKP